MRVSLHGHGAPLLGRLAVVWSVFFGTFFMTASAKRSMRAYYISDTLNTSEDTPTMFALRWSLWLMAIGTVFPTMRAATNTSVATNFVLSWIVCMVTGIQLEVFGGTTPEGLRYSHFAGTGVVFLASVLYFWGLRYRWAAAFWALVSVLYATLFFVRELTAFDMRGEVFVATEYVWFAYVTVLLFVVVPYRGQTSESNPHLTRPSESVHNAHIVLSYEQTDGRRV